MEVRNSCRLHLPGARTPGRSCRDQPSVEVRHSPEERPRGAGRHAESLRRRRHSHGHRKQPGRGLMPQGQPEQVPKDGLSTRQRRNRPLTIVHTGVMKGKSTAAFGLALRGWSQGWNIGVFQFVKSAKWKVGEEAAFRTLGRVHAETGEGGPVEWHKMGEGWSWARKPGSSDDHAAQAAEGWAEIRR